MAVELHQRALLLGLHGLGLPAGTRDGLGIERLLGEAGRASVGLVEERLLSAAHDGGLGGRGIAEELLRNVRLLCLAKLRSWRSQCLRSGLLFVSRLDLVRVPAMSRPRCSFGEW